MKIAVLLSDARHPVSGRAVVSRLEAQAIGLARALAGDLHGLHAGPSAHGLSEAFGHGIGRIEHLKIAEGSDPVAALAEALKTGTPDLILAGRRGQGGSDTGLVPYCLAEALGLPLVADAIAIRGAEAPGTIEVDAALPKGARRRMVIRLPAIVTVHPMAPPPKPFVYAALRRGNLQTRPVASVAEAETPFAERGYRFRPMLMRTAQAGSGSSDRLKVHVDPDPRAAAQLILDYLETNGIRRL